MEGVENVELASECSSSVTTTTKEGESSLFCFSCDRAYVIQILNSDKSENMGKAKIANLEKSQKKDRGDSVKIGTLSTPMPRTNLGNRWYRFR